MNFWKKLWLAKTYVDDCSVVASNNGESRRGDAGEHLNVLQEWEWRRWTVNGERKLTRECLHTLLTFHDVLGSLAQQRTVFRLKFGKTTQIEDDWRRMWLINHFVIAKRWFRRRHNKREQLSFPLMDWCQNECPQTSWQRRAVDDLRAKHKFSTSFLLSLLEKLTSATFAVAGMVTIDLSDVQQSQAEFGANHDWSSVGHSSNPGCDWAFRWIAWVQNEHARKLLLKNQNVQK